MRLSVWEIMHIMYIGLMPLIIYLLANHVLKQSILFKYALNTLQILALLQKEKLF